jgi:5-methylcytosine-specific restriction endonuclease McrA
MDTSGKAGRTCRWCGDIIQSSKSYCSDQCEDRFVTWLKNEPSIIRGVKPPFWNFIRRFALERDNYRCQFCGTTSDLSVHHIIPLSSGGDSTLDNLRVLCHSCHQKEHLGRIPIPRKKRFRIRIRHQPMYIPAPYFGDWTIQYDTEVHS